MNFWYFYPFFQNVVFVRNRFKDDMCYLIEYIYILMLWIVDFKLKWVLFSYICIIVLTINIQYFLSLIDLEAITIFESASAFLCWTILIKFAWIYIFLLENK